MSSFFKIYNPSGIHTKDNPCGCGHCDKYPEFFHALPYSTRYNSDWESMIELRDEHYPNGVILEFYSTNQGYGDPN